MQAWVCPDRAPLRFSVVSPSPSPLPHTHARLLPPLPQPSLPLLPTPANKHATTPCRRRAFTEYYKLEISTANGVMLKDGNCSEVDCGFYGISVVEGFMGPSASGCGLLNMGALGGR